MATKGCKIKTGRKEAALLRRVIIQERGKCCELCYSLRRIQMHHIDLDRTNNTRGNVILLCENHHKEAHKKRTSLTPKYLKQFIIAKFGSQTLEDIRYLDGYYGA